MNATDTADLIALAKIEPGKTELPCQQHPEGWFSTQRDVVRAAAAWCRQCPIVAECRRIGERYEYGTWAGELKRAAS